MIERFVRCYRLVSLLVLALSVGCEQTAGTGQERYVPPEATARATIHQALQAWQRGEPSGELKGTKPLIFVTDSHRKIGQTLEHFEILGQVTGATPRCYLVKAKFSNPDADEKFRYAVVGIDPLWVYRHEDLEMLLHWEHPMPGPSAATVTNSDQTADSGKSSEVSP